MLYNNAHEKYSLLEKVDSIMMKAETWEQAVDFVMTELPVTHYHKKTQATELVDIVLKLNKALLNSRTMSKTQINHGHG